MATRSPKIPGASEPQPLPETQPAAPAVTLPNSFEVDPLAITEPTLTRQGWIVPAPKPRA